MNVPFEHVAQRNRPRRLIVITFIMAASVMPVGASSSNAITIYAPQGLHISIADSALPVINYGWSVMIR